LLPRKPLPRRRPLPRRPLPRRRLLPRKPLPRRRPLLRRPLPRRRLLPRKLLPRKLLLKRLLPRKPLRRSDQKQVELFREIRLINRAREESASKLPLPGPVSFTSTAPLALLSPASHLSRSLIGRDRMTISIAQTFSPEEDNTSADFDLESPEPLRERLHDAAEGIL